MLWVLKRLLVSCVGPPFLFAATREWETPQWHRTYPHWYKVSIFYFYIYMNNPIGLDLLYTQCSKTKTIYIAGTRLTKSQQDSGWTWILKKGRISSISIQTNLFFVIWFFLKISCRWWSRRIRDELTNQNAETSNLTNKLDRVSIPISSFSAFCMYVFLFMFCFNLSQEIHTLRAQLEAAKYEVIKYCIGTLVSISAVGLAVLRIVMWLSIVDQHPHLCCFFQFWMKSWSALSILWRILIFYNVIWFPFCSIYDERKKEKLIYEIRYKRIWDVSSTCMNSLVVCTLLLDVGKCSCDDEPNANDG